MQINKKFRFIVCGAIFISLHIFSSKGPDRQDFYKKDFTVDREHPEKYIKLRADGLILHPFFSPNFDVQGILVGLMGKEESSLKMTIYSLRDRDIYGAILGALKRGVRVEIVFDKKFQEERFAKKLMELGAAGAVTYIFKGPEKKPHEDVTGIMHNKYVIFEKNIYGEKLLWSGSCNFSSSSHRLNQENVFVSNRSRLIEKFEVDFVRMKHEYCRPDSTGDEDYYYQESDDQDSGCEWADDEEQDEDVPRRKRPKPIARRSPRLQRTGRKRKRASSYKKEEQEETLPPRKRQKMAQIIVAADRLKRGVRKEGA